MRITERQLRSIIKEEYLRSTPVRPGMLMSEARAEYLAQEILDEGLWSSIKSLGAGAKAAVGGAASVVMKPLDQAAEKIALAAAETAKSAYAAIKLEKDKVKAAALEASMASMETSIKAAIKTAMQDAMKHFVKAKMTEDEAKAEASKLAIAATAGAISP